jgi:type I restriction enzyme M protein
LAVDFTARQESAAAEARPHRAQESVCSAEARALEEKWKSLRKQKARPAVVKAAEEAWKLKQRKAREAAAKAEAIENAVYDLKAVNPNRAVEEDRRTPAQLLDEIAARGREVESALAMLRRIPAT